MRTRTLLPGAAAAPLPRVGFRRPVAIVVVGATPLALKEDLHGLRERCERRMSTGWWKGQASTAALDEYVFTVEQDAHGVGGEQREGGVAWRVGGA